MAASESIVEMFAELSTPLVADACVRHDVPLRAAPPGIAPVVPGRRIAGRVLPSRRSGSVDIFLGAFSLHRDTTELVEIGFPVFSYGSYPSGPVRVDEREPEALASARFGAHVVTADDIVFADDDGVLFVAAALVEQVLEAARAIWTTERTQAGKIAAGETLRRQTEFDGYLTRRGADPSYTFRQHLRRIGGAIEE